VTELEVEPRILVVDDQPANLTAMDAVFSHLPYEIVPAASGKEALRYAHDFDFAVILLDVQMPGMDGFEVAERIRQIERAKTTPIIFLTANYSTDDYALRGYEAGAVDYLYKPLKVDLLRAKVRVFVDLFTKNRELMKKEHRIRQFETLMRDQELARVRKVGQTRYQNLVDGIRDGIVWAADPVSLQFSFVSRQAEGISGYTVDEWQADPEFWRRNLHPEDRARVLELFARAAKREDGLGIEHRFVRGDGRIVWLFTRVHFEAEGEQDQPEIQGLSVDITQLKNTERALREAIRVRDEFLSIASHELRTPITPLQLQIQGFMRMVETGKIRDVAPEQLTDMLKISEAQVTRLERLISQLLDVSRLRSGRLMLDVKPMRVADLVRRVLEQLQHAIELSECDLVVRLDEALVAPVDPLRFEQVLINLMTNAMKYAAGKRVEVTVSGSSGHVSVVVRDEGIGIRREDHERIFERFERAVSAMHYGGLGLGLYITRQIVELHSGTIRVESEPGKGARFTVEIPA
jgi:PAS domain S-box-containing protein